MWLELSGWPRYFAGCRFTNLSAENAERKTRSWCDRTIGREQSVRVAVLQNSVRNFRFLPQPEAGMKRRFAPASLVRAACAERVDRTRTEAAGFVSKGEKRAVCSRVEFSRCAIPCTATGDGRCFILPRRQRRSASFCSRVDLFSLPGAGHGRCDRRSKNPGKCPPGSKHMVAGC